MRSPPKRTFDCVDVILEANLSEGGEEMPLSEARVSVQNF